MDVKVGELIVFDKEDYKWEKKIEGRRQRGGVSYSPLGWTWHVSAPT